MINATWLRRHPIYSLNYIVVTRYLIIWYYIINICDNICYIIKLELLPLAGRKLYRNEPVACGPDHRNELLHLQHSQKVGKFSVLLFLRNARFRELFTNINRGFSQELSKSLGKSRDYSIKLKNSEENIIPNIKLVPTGRPPFTTWSPRSTGGTPPWWRSSSPSSSSSSSVTPSDLD